jgi:hypothetical protein
MRLRARLVPAGVNAPPRWADRDMGDRDMGDLGYRAITLTAIR